MLLGLLLGRVLLLLLLHGRLVARCHLLVGRLVVGHDEHGRAVGRDLATSTPGRTVNAPEWVSTYTFAGRSVPNQGDA